MAIEPTAEAILEFAAEWARKEWNENQQPYLLARLSPDLAGKDIDYKSVLGGQRLKDFIGGAPDRVKVVIHPSQKSKIGLIPPDKDFEFDVAFTKPESFSRPTSNESGHKFRRRHIVLDFLLLLSDLNESDAVQVQIPVHILAKLMQDR